MEEGLQIGREEGLEEGLQIGREEGLEEGLQKGLEEGERKKQLETAKTMLLDKMPLALIMKYSGLTEGEIKELEKI